MDDLRLQTVAARVVAWHNRHPLARRIGPQQVRSVGYVALSVGADADADADAVTVPDVPPSAHQPLADAAPPGEPAAPAEEDFTAAFAALAEHHAADAQPAVAEDAAAQAAVAVDTAVDTAVAVDTADAADAVHAADGADGADGADADAFEIELDVAADTEAVASAPGAEAAAEDSDVATLLAPEPSEQPAPAPVPVPAEAVAKSAPHIPTLRDRVLVRAQQPAVQGALLTTHEGYRPTVHPRAATPAWALAAAEHGEGDHFMAPLSPRALARWVAQHGRALRPPPVDGPVRRVSTAAVAGGPVAGTAYVMTAAIAGGGLTSRVLVGAGTPGAVLGSRLWSPPRVATAALLGALLLATAAVAVAGWLRPAAAFPAAAADAVASVASAASAASHATAASAEPAASTAPAEFAASAAAAARAASAPEAAAAALTEGVSAAAAHAAASEATGAEAPPHEPGVGTTAHSPAHLPAHPPAQPPKGAPASAELAVTTVKPVPAYAQKGAVGLPPRGLGLSEADKAAAREAVAAARAGRPAAPRATGGTPPADEAQAAGTAGTAGAGPQAAPAAAAPPAEVPAGPSFAVSTRALRTRAEAEQLQVAISALLRTPGAASRRVELLPEGDDWRVVAWPFIGQPEADRVRALLAGRGMKVDVVRF